MTALFEESGQSREEKRESLPSDHPVSRRDWVRTLAMAAAMARATADVSSVLLSRCSWALALLHMALSISASWMTLTG
jgi:hypothetical protein